MIVKEIYFRWRQCTPSEDPYRVNTPPQTGAIPGSYRFFFSLRNVHSRPKNRQFSQVCECGDNKHLFLLLKPNNQSSIPVVQKVQLSQALKTLFSGFGLPASPDPSGAILISPTDQADVETI